MLISLSLKLSLSVSSTNYSSNSVSSNVGILMTSSYYSWHSELYTETEELLLLSSTNCSFRDDDYPDSMMCMTLHFMGSAENILAADESLSVKSDDSDYYSRALNCEGSELLSFKFTKLMHFIVLLILFSFAELLPS